MMVYSIAQICAIFAIDVSTLRRWTAAAGVRSQAAAADQRRRCYAEADVLRLAELHQRVISLPSAPAPAPAPAPSDLAARLVQLEQRVAELERNPGASHGFA